MKKYESVILAAVKMTKAEKDTSVSSTVASVDKPHCESHVKKTPWLRGTSAIFVAESSIFKIQFTQTELFAFHNGELLEAS